MTLSSVASTHMWVGGRNAADIRDDISAEPAADVGFGFGVFGLGENLRGFAVLLEVVSRAGRIR